MTIDDLDKIEALVKSASPGPWFVRHLDDELCMSAVVVSTRPQQSEQLAMRFGNWPSDEVIAATLIQSPPYVMPREDRWDENAALIAALRNAAPELLRLARIGLSVEAAASD